MQKKSDSGSFWFEHVIAKQNLTSNFVFCAKYINWLDQELAFLVNVSYIPLQTASGDMHE